MKRGKKGSKAWKKIKSKKRKVGLIIKGYPKISDPKYIRSVTFGYLIFPRNLPY